MTFALSRDARKEAGNAAKQAEKFLSSNGQTLSDLTARYGKKAQALYPELVTNLRQIADKSGSTGKHYLASAGRELNAARHVAGGRIQWSALKIGAGYALFKWLGSKPEVARAATQVRAHVQAQPVESAVIALAAGIIIGRIFR